MGKIGGRPIAKDGYSVMPQAKDANFYTQILEKNKDIQDLLDKIQFDSQHGKIWFEENRMLLMHTSIMGFLKKICITCWVGNGLSVFLFVWVIRLV